MRLAAFANKPTLLLMSLVPNATPLAGAFDCAPTLLGLSGDDRHDSPGAAGRLQALGRCWVADALLGFRDRFASPISKHEYYKVRERDGGHSVTLAGNADNVLLTTVEMPPGAGVVAIDCQSKHVKPSSAPREENLQPAAQEASTQAAAALGAHGWTDRVCHIFEGLLVEAKGANAPLAPPAACVEFLQYMVRVNTGYVLSDAALCEVRLGALYALREVPGAMRWAESCLAELQGENAEFAGCEYWAANARCIDGEALQALGAAVCKLTENHTKLLQSLPKALPMGLPAEVRPLTHVVEASEVAEATPPGATPKLWQALSHDLRVALRREQDSEGCRRSR